MEAARGRPRATFFGSRRLAGAAPATVRAADPGHAGRTPPAKSEAGGFMDDGGILRLRVQGRSSLRLRVYGQRRHAQSKSRGSQCDRELTHRSPPSVKRPKKSGCETRCRGTIILPSPNCQAFSPIRLWKTQRSWWRRSPRLAAPTKRRRRDSLSRFVGPSSQRASKGEPIHETRDHTPEFARVFLKAQFGRSPLHPGDATMLIFMIVVGFVAAILINFFG